MNPELLECLYILIGWVLGCLTYILYLKITKQI